MHDWVLNAAAANAELSITADRIRLSNGLVQREVETAGCRTVSLQNNQKQLQLIDNLVESLKKNATIEYINSEFDPATIRKEVQQEIKEGSEKAQQLEKEAKKSEKK